MILGPIHKGEGWGESESDRGTVSLDLSLTFIHIFLPFTNGDQTQSKKGLSAPGCMYKLCMHMCACMFAYLGVRATLLPSRKMRIMTRTENNDAHRYVGGQH